ncbi:hypothetical protein J416_10641 [Gracilibacillus halophilus YIM-C55.5]|uniref:CwlT-like lysozyme domain-containing protein n=1 Tax=Gracilibacillus halophilus YIM-C55.5 TaxID=1308866 RepID=N4WB30_9BACI|nr:lysozyme family protein [Gracilibacillus halophilus]ENH96464.1 hypothetical protein J416_10641 [Gracilibacillus halophilus YIM-C55.5]
MRKKQTKGLDVIFTIIKIGVLIAGVLVLIVWFYHHQWQTTIMPDEKRLTENVLQYKEDVQAALKSYDREEYTGVILALMMQESAGRGNDPMQASESYCGEVGCIDDPSLSIEQGVRYFVNVLEKTNEDVLLTLQSYNFGAGFIDYVQERGGNYTKELAIAFSQEKYQDVKDTGNYSCIREEAEPYRACYGDILYVQSVLDYYPEAKKAVDEDVRPIRIPKIPEEN